MDHMRFLKEISEKDIRQLEEKEKTYKGSWKKRGGVGAFMMLARKWDRLEEICKRADYDIFEVCREMSGRDGTALAEVRDLRTYLLLIEAEMIARVRVFPDGTPKEDSNRHATDAAVHAGDGLGASGKIAEGAGQYVGLNRSGDA